MWGLGIGIGQVEHFPTPFFAEGDLARYAISVFDPGIWGCRLLVLLFWYLYWVGGMGFGVWKGKGGGIGVAAMWV